MFVLSHFLCNFGAMKLQKHELSILIPIYNASCVRLVKTLDEQARRLGISYEIIVADDSSPKRELTAPNEAIGQMEHCRYIVKEVNTGSASNRNFLARQAQYGWLLYVDCDLEISRDDFLGRYLSVMDEGVVSGGICIGGDPVELRHSLRYLYEKREEPNHTADHRQQRPYQSFRSCNFMVSREVMLRCPFDERFLRSGYEDVLLGKELKRQGVSITHIDNPVLMTDYEDNASYVVKIERSLETLHQFRNELRGYSRLQTLAEGIHVGAVRWLLKAGFKLTAPMMRHNLSGRHPILKLFDLYRTGYYLSINN